MCDEGDGARVERERRLAVVQEELDLPFIQYIVVVFFVGLESEGKTEEQYDEESRGKDSPQG